MYVQSRLCQDGIATQEQVGTPFDCLPKGEEAKWELKYVSREEGHVVVLLFPALPG